MKYFPTAKLVIVIHLLFSLFIINQLHDFNENNKNISQYSIRLTKLDSIASEIRMSSDWLTKFVRAYAATGDTKYKDYFGFVLSVRRGELAIPKKYTTDFWPAVLSEELQLSNLTSIGGKTIAARLKEIGINQEQLIKLKNAVVYSDELAVTERMIFELTNAQLTDSRYLSNSLYDNAYYLQKQKIMASVNEVLFSLDEELNSAIKDAQEYSAVLYRELISLIILWFLLIAILQILSTRKYKEICSVFENHIATNNLSKTENSMIKNDPSATSLGQIIKSQQGCTDNQVLQFEKQRKMFEDTLVLVIEVFNTRENNSTCLSEVLTNIRKVMKKNLSYFDIADLQFIRLPQNIHSLIEQDGSNKTAVSKSQIIIEKTHITLKLKRPLQRQHDYAQFQLIVDTYDRLITDLISNGQSRELSIQKKH